MVSVICQVAIEIECIDRRRKTNKTIGQNKGSERPHELFFHDDCNKNKRTGVSNKMKELMTNSTLFIHVLARRGQVGFPYLGL